MATIFRLSKYNLTRASAPVLNLDFTTPEYTFGEYKGFFLKDFLGLYSFIKGNGINSEFLFQIDSDQFKILKNHDVGTIEFYLNEAKSEKDFFKYLSEKYGLNLIPEVWSKRVINFQEVSEQDFSNQLNLINSSITPSINNTVPQTDKTESLKNSLFEGKGEDEKKKIEKMIDLKTKIKALDLEVQLYQSSKTQKEEFEKKNVDLENEKKMFNERKSSIELLLESRKKVIQDIQKISGNNNVQISESVKQQKIQGRIDELKKLRNVPSSNLNKSLKKSERVFKGRGFIVLGIVQIVLTLILFVISSESNLILIGLLSFFTIVVATYILNSQKEEVYFDLVKNNIVEVDAKPQEDESKIFVNSAIVGALTHELSNIDTNIKSRLGSKTLEDFQKELSELNAKEQALAAEQSNNVSSLSPEDYYKKRRELDILKIESENLEYDKSLNIDQNILDELINANEANNPRENISNLAQSVPILILNLVNQAIVSSLSGAIIVK